MAVGLSACCGVLPKSSNWINAALNVTIQPSGISKFHWQQFYDKGKT